MEKMAFEAQLLTTFSFLFILTLFHFFQTCNATNSDCITSSCGIFSNISYPFRLKGDSNPNHCGDRRAELSCEKNVTFFYVRNYKFYVKEINYPDHSIRLVDASLNNDICSFPTYSSSVYDVLYDNDIFGGFGFGNNFPIYFLSCPYPMRNSSLFVDVTECASHISHPIRPFTYVRMKVSEIPERCELDLIVPTSWEFKDWKNASLSEIHHSLLYGFQLSFFCIDCRPLSMIENFKLFLKRTKGILLILLAFLAIFVAGISIPLAIILGLVLVFVVSFTYFKGLNLWLYLFSGYFTFPNSTYYEAIYGNAGFISVMVITIPRFIIFPLILWFLIYKFRSRRLSSFEGVESFLQSDNKLIPIRYSFSEIRKMTKGFKEKLGQGGYGSVYKGKLRSGNHVAIKLLGKSGANGKDFINEIATIGRIHHVNVVGLVGYCAEGSKRALVYEFMPNGSLDKYLFNLEKMSSLNWDKKFDIAIGVARGIGYLHGGCDVQILHFDIKPHNILLDGKFVPKISDFGLAKLCSTDKDTVTLTAVRGTIGYVAPELISRSIGPVSYKADVYSFGMLLMEMVGLNRDMKGNHGDSSKYFPNWIYDCIEHGRVTEIEIVDENDDDDNTKNLVRKMTIVGLWCILMSPTDRPSMKHVLQMLEGDVEHLQIPDYPCQSIHNNGLNMVQSGSNCLTATVSLLHHNDASSSVAISVQE